MLLFWLRTSWSSLNALSVLTSTQNVDYCRAPFTSLFIIFNLRGGGGGLKEGSRFNGIRNLFLSPLVLL